MSPQKKELRHYYITQRINIRPIDFKKKNKLLIENLIKYVVDNSFQVVFIFLPINNEPNLSNLKKKLSKSHQFALPVITENNEMNFYVWNSKTVLVKNKYNIFEPSTNQIQHITPNSKTLICVPSLAVDLKGYRLGYGGGYYDRYLKNNPSLHTLGIVFNQYVVKNLPFDPWDVRLNKACTNKGIISLS